MVQVIWDHYCTVSPSTRLGSGKSTPLTWIIESTNQNCNKGVCHTCLSLPILSGRVIWPQPRTSGQIRFQQWRWHWFPPNVSSRPWAGQWSAWKNRNKRVCITVFPCLWSWTKIGREIWNGVSVTARKHITAPSILFPDFKQAEWKALGLFKFFWKYFSAFCPVQ